MTRKAEQMFAWMFAVQWDDERPGSPVPKEFLP
ncbi:MAG: hypothetical protein QOH96_2981 [Blastocatellia bacterium]|jgi:hypothetical protein|nr:hypothetical protein [Blastocatellia bacterium]